MPPNWGRRRAGSFRVSMLNRSRAKNAKEGDARFSPKDFITFNWPQVFHKCKKGKKQYGTKRLTFMTAWRCRSSTGCWKHAKRALEHKCSAWLTVVRPELLAFTRLAGLLPPLSMELTRPPWP